MVDPTSDLGEGVDESDAHECANCGETILQSPTHRVVTWVEDGEARHRHFCSEECRAAYDAESDDPADE
ncbi:DUF7576 family protein [Halopelagius longus]|uniref:Small CPxCG-related zinc finger protein n=1 Tax=Halopelagius longus TaxID=1236180 RepID=A0A1H1B1D8_9EURY|nr:hypothetical protein [Halopelagius longus]RDI70602.1 hypothetical protein DWB78_02050 [Halopelagius longus]SDQ45739.1 hypothetical protein SAMN05216278_1590 [Halopelagius longus]